MMMRPIILLLAISVSSALKSTTDRYMPDMWYTKENITDDIRRGIDWLDFENSADCVARQRVFPKISDGFKIIQTPADIQRMLVERLDICCPKEKRYLKTIQQCGNPEGTKAALEYINRVDREKSNRYRTSLCDISGSQRRQMNNVYRNIFQDWIGEEVDMTALYGMRSYFENATLRMHADRFDTHIVSAILNVAQDTDIDWPIVILDHEGTPHDLTLEPGQTLLYESARLVHGRPYSFQGNSYTNIFLHSRPKSWAGEIYRKNLDREKLQWMNANREAYQRFERDFGTFDETTIRFENGYNEKFLDCSYSASRNKKREFATTLEPGENVSFTGAFDGSVFQFSAAGTDKPLHRVRIDGREIAAWRSSDLKNAEKDYVIRLKPSQSATERDTNVQVKMRNRLDVDVELYWYDRGTLHLMSALGPRREIGQSTTVGHRFIAKVAGEDKEIWSHTISFGDADGVIDILFAKRGSRDRRTIAHADL